MSDTPLTDAQATIGPLGSKPSPFVETDFARDLERKLANALAWKESMLKVESEWDVQVLATMLGGTLGQSCRKVIAERVPQLIAERDEARKQNAVLREALKNLVPIAAIHQAQPENMSEADFYDLVVAIRNAQAALAATEEA